ncbi:receptor-like protein kinase BRI1-like 3 [Triticum dicoccoides]|uniref:receptor-like protein kinase BRI1-like 3 n=1 Tax=Triticum dicoccoides TaxID=85692 RepID=UPI001891E2C2|nr:receptor-like protein kinase BRI1-like 3 [Triticum dicoccoides]
MGRIPAVAAAIVVALLVCCSCEVRGKEDEDVLDSLVDFLTKLAGGDEKTASDLGWDASTDPCDGTGGRNGSDSKWGGTVKCFENGASNAGLIKVIDLQSLGLNGTIDAESLCAAPALRVVSLQNNTLRGGLPAGVSACSGLTHLYVDRNQLSGALPSSLGNLRKLHVLDVSRNDFSGEIPAGLSDVRGLIRFNANDNHFQGTIPDFDLDKFETFNVSNNNLTGPIPKNTGRFRDDSFAANAAGMCGEPMFSPCPSGESKSKKTRRILMYLGYVLLGAVIVAFVVYKLCSRKRNKLGKKAMEKLVVYEFQSNGSLHKLLHAIIMNNLLTHANFYDSLQKINNSRFFLITTSQ